MKDSRKITKKEEKYWEDKEEFDWLNEKSIKSILNYIPKPTGDTLELCSGSGMFTRFMDFKNSKRYVCLDLSQRLLKKLKSYLSSVEIKKGDAQDLNFSDSCFDNIYIFAGLHHLPNIDSCISSSYRMLRKGGRFVCFEPNKKCFYRGIMHKLRNVLGLYTTDEVFLDPIFIANKLKKSKFNNIKIKYLTPNYKFEHIGILYPLFIIMKLISIIPSKYFQTFFIITCEK